MEKIKTTTREEVKSTKDDSKAFKDEIKSKDETKILKDDIKPTKEEGKLRDELKVKDELKTSAKEEIKLTNQEMAPAYKLTYFDLTALGEPIRFLLSYGGIEFEDNRIPKDKWPALKSSMPFGQMPVLEHNGKVAHQSVAICRYLAKQVKLVGKDDWEDLEIDAAMDTITDLRLKIGQYHYEQDEKLKEAKAGPVFNEILPFYLEKLDAQAKKNNGYLTVGRLTWADIYFIAMLDYLNFMAKKDIIANSPNLIAVKENVLKLPNIKTWIEKRPKDNL